MTGKTPRSDDHDGDFDLSGFTGGGPDEAKSGESGPASSGDEPTPDRPVKPRNKIIGKPKPDGAKGPPARAPRDPSRDFRSTSGRGDEGPRGVGGPGGTRGAPGGTPRFPDRDAGSRRPGGAGAPRGAGGPAGSRGEGGDRWEKRPPREGFRGRDEGFRPGGGTAGPGGSAGSGGAGRGYAERGNGPRGPGGPGGPARDFNRPRALGGPGGSRGPGGPGGQAGPGGFSGGLRNIERVAGAHKPASPEVKPYLPLKTDKGRYKESQFLLEGGKNIADVLAVSPAMIQKVFLAEDFKDKDLISLLKSHRIEVVHATEDDIRALSDAETPQGILAVANFATLRPDWTTARYITLLDAVQDPGNVGAILRTSLALGMDAVVLGKGSCDPYNPKVVRSSVGALMRLPFETGEDIGAKMEFLRLKGFSIVATSSHAQLTLEQAKLRKKVALIVGNEGAGTGPNYQDMADAVVKIPLRNKVESLNVSVAHGILTHQLIYGRT